MQPAPRLNPGDAHAQRQRVIGEVHPDAPRVLVRESVLERILDYSEQDLSRELGGFLLGGYPQGPQADLEVREFMPAVDARSRAASLTFTHETWAAMNREAVARYPAERVVGWHHTHPRLRVFLSGYDLFIHRHFFAEPWQIAMVVDPVSQEFGFFQWRCGELTGCGFICVRDDHA